jgi:tetratricopeptide (TPR) repeat protein
MQQFRRALSRTISAVTLIIVCGSVGKYGECTLAVADETAANPAHERSGIPDALLRKAPETFRESYRYVNKAIHEQAKRGQPIDPLLFISRAELALHVMDKSSALSDIRAALDAIEQVPAFERGALQRRCIELTIGYHEVPDIQFATDASSASVAGDLALRRGKYLQASKLFEAAAKLDRKDYRSCYLAAACFNELERGDLAKMWLAEAVEREAKRVRSYRGDVSASFLRYHHARELELLQGPNRTWVESEVLRVFFSRTEKTKQGSQERREQGVDR